MRLGMGVRVQLQIIKKGGGGRKRRTAGQQQETAGGSRARARRAHNIDTGQEHQTEQVRPGRSTGGSGRAGFLAVTKIGTG